MTRKTVSREWILYHEDGELIRSLPVDLLEVPPRVEYIGEFLRWSFFGGGRGPHPVKPGKGMLRDFMDLAEASVDNVVQYARRWGVLGLCEHGLPYAHNASEFPLPWIRWNTKSQRYELPLPENVYGARYDSWKRIATAGNRNLTLVKQRPCQPAYVGLASYIEPIDDWFEWARSVRATMHIAATLHEGKPGSESDWTLLQPGKQFSGIHIWEQDRATQWVALTLLLNEWASLAGLRPVLSVDDDAPTFLMGVPQVSVGRLFGVLVLEMMAAISRSTGFKICRDCGTPFVRQGRGGDGYKYCEDCGTKAAWRRASKKYRHKKAGLLRHSREP